MAVRTAVASGNWSNPAIWNGGVLPNPGDIVASNNFTVTIDVNFNVDSITNAAQAVVDAVPNMTSPTTPSGIITESTTVSGFEGWKAFDGGTSLEWRPTGQQWVAYEFTAPKAIDQYYFTGDTIKNAWKFEAWDGTNWITLHTITGASVQSYLSPLLGNSTQYIKYRFFTLDFITHRFREIDFYEYLGTSPAIAGGGFILNNGLTVTLTGSTSISQGSITVLTVPVTTGNTSTLIGNNFVRANVSNQPLIVLSGSGTFNVTGNISGAGTNTDGIKVTGLNSTLNFLGNIQAGSGPSSHGINTDVVCTINVVGSVTGGGGSNGAIGVRFNSSGSFTLVGTAVGGSYTNHFGVFLNNTTAIITGDLLGGNAYDSISAGLQADNNANITMTGVMYGRLAPAFRSSSNIYLNHYGTINSTGLAGIAGSQSNVAIFSTGAGAIHILTGPFISSPTGIQPLYIFRMHYRRTMGSYYEFRDNSTLGALPPSAPAPATRLVSPDTVADSPVPRDVRQGTIYAEGSQTGTMIVPSRDNVAKGVLVDNTTGTAILDADSIWAVPLTSVNTLNSIGRRVKNAATVETTGAQIQQTLNDNE